MSDALSEVAVHTVDPDAQAIVTDFIDYTQRLPADLIRSLSLIRSLDHTYQATSSAVHELTKTYGSLPSIPEQDRPNPVVLRSQISHQLSRAISARGSSYAEASRLYDLVDHHFNRLTSIAAKLQALPMPPSRDPSPEPHTSASHPVHRNKGINAHENNNARPQRIRLRLDRTRSAGAGQQESGGNSRRGRATVPGEILPLANSDIASPSFESDWESPPPSPGPVHPVTGGTPGLARESKPPKPKKTKPEKAARPPRPPGTGTNVHSAIAGISTSNALALLEPPPDDAVPGSEHAPWLRLTQWEMAKLRKRMKKNAVWKPSETMIRRELASLDRGPEKYHAAKARAEATGEPFVDAANIAKEIANPSKRVLAEGEIGVDSLGMEEIQLSNRGMKLNEAKKLKKENQQRELAAQAAAEAELAARRVAELKGEAKANILKVGEGFVSSTDEDKTASEAALELNKSQNRPQNKRRREASVEQGTEDTIGDGNASGRSRKRIREAVNVEPSTTEAASTTTVPLAPEGPTVDVGPGSKTTPIEDSRSKGPAARRHASVAAKSKSPDAPSTLSRSRGTTAPAEQVRTAGRDRPRRASTISTAAVDNTAPARPTTRKGRRPVPGRLTAESGQGGTAVTVGKRTAAPRKKTSAKRSESETQELEEKVDEIDEEGLPVDLNEPRYCICGDVSYGIMIMCENNDVSARKSPVTPSVSF